MLWESAALMFGWLLCDSCDQIMWQLGHVDLWWEYSIDVWLIIVRQLWLDYVTVRTCWPVVGVQYWCLVDYLCDSCDRIMWQLGHVDLWWECSIDVLLIIGRQLWLDYVKVRTCRPVVRVQYWCVVLCVTAGVLRPDQGLADEDRLLPGQHGAASYL